MIAKYMLSFVGSFMLVAGFLAQTYAPDKMLRTPTDVSQVTKLSGTAQAVGLDAPVQVNVTNRTQGVPGLSNEETMTWRTAACVVVADEGVPECVAATDTRWKLVQASTSSFVTTRDTATGIDDESVLPEGAVPTSGIVNKWPFGAEKKTYPYWDSALGRTVDAKYVRTEDLDGLETYVYAIDVPTTEVELAAGVMGTYSNNTEIYIEPATGAVINQDIDQRRMLASGEPAFVLQASFTDEQLADSIEDGKANKRKLTIALGYGPYIAYGLGILLLAAAFWMDRRSRRRSAGEAKDAPAPPQPAAV